MAERELYHGLDGESLSWALENGTLVPDANHEIYFDYTSFSACFVHGVDRALRKSFVIRVRVDLDGRDWRIDDKPGNPTTLIVTTQDPLPIEILELFVRSGDREEGFQVTRILGLEEMMHQLT